MCKKLNLLRLFTFSILFFVSIATVCPTAENIKRTIKVNYDKTTTGEITVVADPGAEYTFEKGAGFPVGASIEWKDQTTDRGSWKDDNVLLPYGPPKTPNKYTITAVLVGEGEGEGPGWEYTVNGTIADPVLTYSEPGEDTYFAEGQTTPTPQVDLKVTVTKPGGTKLEGVSVLFVAKKSDDSIVNIGTGVATSFNRIIEILNTILGTNFKPDYFDNPYDFYQNHTHADTTLAMEALGFEAKYSIQDGIRNYLEV